MEIDRERLQEEFDMGVVDDISELEPINYDDPQDVIRSNMERANRILNILESELNRGNITNRAMEVASALINSVTLSSKELIADNNYKKYLQVREKMIKYKYDELEFKKNKKEQPTNQNLIIASREDILKVISAPEVKQVEE